MRDINCLSPYDTNEKNEGTLDKCKCGREVFISFRDGFLCNLCKNHRIKIKLTNELVEKVFKKYSKED